MEAHIHGNFFLKFVINQFRLCERFGPIISRTTFYEKKQKQKKQEMVSHAIIQGYSLGVLSFFLF